MAKIGIQTIQYRSEGDLAHEYNPLHNIIEKKDTLVTIENYNKSLSEIKDFTVPASELGVDLNNPVDIECQPSYDGSVNLIINDDKNPPRIINTRYSVIEDNRYKIINRNQVNQTNLYDLNNIDEEITCESVSKLNKEDYEYCFVKINEEGKATVTIEGKGKFKGMGICNASKETSEISDTCSTDSSYFYYQEVEDGILIRGYDAGTPKVTVKDESKCKNYLINSWNDDSEEGQSDATTLCSGNALDSGYTLERAVSDDNIPSTDYEEAGLEVSLIKIEKVTVKDEGKCKNYMMSDKLGNAPEEIATTLCSGNALDNGLTLKGVISRYYNSSTNYEEVGLELTIKPFNKIVNVIIPGSINDKKVVAIGGFAFDSKQLISVVIPNSVTDIEYNAFNNNQLTNVTIPDNVTSIGNSAFSSNQLTTVTIPSSVTSIGDYAFGKSNSSNPNLTKIINKTGKSFDWGDIVNGSSGYNFVTGTVVNSSGNVEVVNN